VEEIAGEFKAELCQKKLLGFVRGSVAGENRCAAFVGWEVNVEHPDG